MALRLRIVSEHRRALGSRSTVMLGVSGGSIGRAADNDLVLPDRSLFVSGHHARISFREGRYFLEDTSTNGTWVNEEEEPLQRRRAVELNDGDILRFGDYHVLVSLDRPAETDSDRTEALAVERALLLNEDVALPAVGTLAAAAGLGLPPRFAPQSMQPLLDDAVGASGGFRIGNAFGQAVAVPFLAAPAARSAEPPIHAEESDSEAVAARRLDRLQRAIEREEMPLEDTPCRPGLEALARGAGIDPVRMRGSAAAATLQLAGRLLRETLVGLKDLDLRRADARRRAGLSDRPGATDSVTPSLGWTTEELLGRLLFAGEGRRPEPGQWLRQQFESLRRHDEALDAAGRAAFLQVVQQLEPRELEERFLNETGQRGRPASGSPSWELYREFYRSLLDGKAAGALPHAYLEAHAQAYSESVGRRAAGE
jgi:type VI secretion system protein